MWISQRARASVGARSDGSEDIAQGVADGGVEGSGIGAGCGFDPQDFLCVPEFAEEVGVGCGREF
jgi:hypothetical protein